jgi:GntR family transcriptional regulator, transcriptional repressor for pyruvate dehydrogenase complex
MILSGELSEGSRLPSERRLAADLKVSRSSLREALASLELLGLVRIEPARGAFVAAAGGADGGGGVARHIAKRYRPCDVYQMRLANEAYAARLAAMRMTADDLSTLRATHASFKAAVADQDLVSSSLFDFEFHHLVIHGSGNRMIADFARSYRAVFLASQRLPMAQQRRRWEPVIEHERVIEALVQRDSDGAAYFMRLHITKAAAAAGVDVAHLP